jgi:Flp pilus assembly secretin CpaC
MEAATPAPAPTPEVPISAAEGGAVESGKSGFMPFADENGKLGFIGLAIIGVTLASLFYSIYWYRKNIQIMEEERDDNGDLAQDVTEIKRNLKKLLGTNYQAI